MLAFLWISFVLALWAPRGDGFAAWMTKDFCDRQLDEGEIIMNEAAILTNERQVRVFREDKELPSGAAVYVPKEILTVQISDSTGQFVLESQHAEFVGGGCKHKNRVVKNHASLKMPESGTVNVTIKAGWSMGHQQVHLTPSFVLVAPRKRKATIPGKHHSGSGDHHRAIGSAGSLSDLSSKVSGLFGSKHSKEKHEKSVQDKERKLNAEKAAGAEERKKKHGAVDTDKEVSGGKLHKKSKKHTGTVNVHTDFETKEEADKEQEEVESKHKKHGGKSSSKTNWRHAAKIIENKLRGTAAEGEDNANIVLVAMCVVCLIVVFAVYSIFRANRFKLSKMLRRDNAFKE